MNDRFIALDRLRAVAVLSMIQGHTFSALLAPGALPSWFMNVHALIHGLTAPAFLFGAGLAFGVSTYPRYAQHRVIGPPLFARLRRVVVLLLIGYALQLPGASLFAAFHLREDELSLVLRIGPLHLIAFCLLVCQLSVRWVRTPARHALLSLSLGLAAMALSPVVWAHDLGTRLGPLIGPWVDGARGSLFPIFPWASFVFLGVASAGVPQLVAPSARRARTWLAVGAGLALTAYAAFLSGVRLSDARFFWQASPLNVSFRIGLVMMLLGALHLAARSETRAALIARHSLVAYVVHLLLLYGTPWTPNLERRFGLALTAGSCTLVCALVLGLTLLTVYGWAWLGRERATQRDWLQAALTLLSLFVLIR